MTGCGIYESYGFDYKQLSSIERGMSFKEVCTILGEPAFRDLNKEGEAWTFRAYTPAGWSAVKVWFKDGKVDEMKSYLEDTYPVTTSRDKSFMDEKKESSDKSSETKVIVSPEGKHYIKMGSVAIPVNLFRGVDNDFFNKLIDHWSSQFGKVGVLLCQ